MITASLCHNLWLKYQLFLMQACKKLGNHHVNGDVVSGARVVVFLLSI